MKYIFGPVNSRRLGRSLGIDLFPRKICNLNCIYCEVGPTRITTTCRSAYSPIQDIISEINTFCSVPTRLETVDAVTVTAKGEPTLHTELGELLSHLQQTLQKPIAVLTNGTTLMIEDVRRQLIPADIVVPSLDAALPRSFAAIDRPDSGVLLQEVLAGLIRFSHEFPGQIWLEMLFVRNCNDSPDDVAALAEAAAQMRLDRIQLNTVVRPPADLEAQPLDLDRLEEIAQVLHQRLNIPVDLPFERSASPQLPDHQPLQAPPDSDGQPSEDIVHSIILMVQRRPSTAIDINRTFNLGGPEKIRQLLHPLVERGILVTRQHAGRVYFHGSSDRKDPPIDDRGAIASVTR